MELTAIYHWPESEYAYLYKDGQLHIRIRTKKEDVKRIVLHYGDPFIFIEDLYEATKEMDKVTTDDLFDYWQVSVSVRHARIQYLFELEDTAGEKILYGDRGVAAYTKENLDFVMNGFKLPFIHEIDGCAVPDWVAQTVWYQIFPERFANGNPALSPEGVRPWDASIAPTMLDFFGGDLQGIIDHLDYLQELGITGLYLCPIFESPSNHKYDTIDYFKIDQHFGDKETFRKLVQEAHARGMKIMLDAVFNHIGYDSPQWQDVVKHGENSIYKDWFHIKKFPVSSENLWNSRDLSYHAFAFAGYMPKKPDLYILGEIWHSSQPWLNGDEFHAVMNYPLSESIKDYFLRGHKETQRFIWEINSQSMYYRQQISEVMFNLLDSHDTERILTTAKGDLQSVKSALAFLYLQRGTPCIYYGTELALIGGPDPDCRRVMPWERVSEDNDMLNFMKDLIQLRKEVAELIQHGKVSLKEVEPDVVAVEWQHEGHLLKAYFNHSKKNVVLEREQADLISHGSISDDRLIIQPNGFVIYRED